MTPEHELVAPTLVRSQALAALYRAARRGDISPGEGMERVTRINSLRVRFLLPSDRLDPAAPEDLDEREG